MGDAKAQVDHRHVHYPGQLESPFAHCFQCAIREIAGQLIGTKTPSGHSVLIADGGS